MLRRAIYTTNSIESLNYQLRKIIKNRGHFPKDDAVIKLLWLAICTIEDKRARARAKETGLGRGAKRKADGHLVEGQTTTNWKQALEGPPLYWRLVSGFSTLTAVSRLALVVSA
jgi:hypothetical protein